MNPCYNAVDFGRDYKHYGRIYPFADRPDQWVTVLWYRVPLDSPYVPYPNPFVLRNWDRLEQEPQTQLGTDQNYVVYYTGPTPLNPPGHVCGSAEMWAEGISYERWIRDEYQCDCPAPVYVVAVNTVRCDDGSLVIAPPTGDVEAHVNLGHVFDWTAHHSFTTDAVGSPNLKIAGIASQTAPFLRVLVPGSHVVAELRQPVATYHVPVFQLQSQDTGGYVIISDQGFVCHDGNDATAITIQTGTPCLFAMSSIWMVSVSNETWIGSRVAVGTTFHATHPSPIGAQLYVDCTNEVSTPGVVVRGTVGGTPQDVALVGDDGNVALLGPAIVGSVSPIGVADLEVYADRGTDGLLIQEGSGIGLGTFALNCTDNGSVVIFGIERDGKIRTNQADVGTTPGTVQGKIPVYDQSGTLLGYVALYDDIT